MRFSIVIPTHQRRDLVARSVAALERQKLRDFETIVVDDGSTDGTGAALRGLDISFPLRVVEQENRGAAAARNAGAAEARGEILLFLDDDMEADPALLEEHDRSHREGADLVLGDVPLHPDSPAGLLAEGVGLWARRRAERLSADGAEIGLGDLLTGQMSISRPGFDRVGGFDSALTREGLFGGEDIDFGYRVLQAGLQIAFNPTAVSHQYYDVDPQQYLRRSFEAGRASEELALKHPERAQTLAAGPAFHTRRSRWLLGPFVAAPRALNWPLRSPVVALVRRGHRGRRLRKLFFALRTLEHQRGARQVRRAKSSHEVIVVDYHAVADLSEDRVLREYGVPPALLAAQLDGLARKGWNFVDLDALLAALDGERRLPRRAILVTFDDAYVDLLSNGCPILAERGIPAVAFAVAGRVGGTNEWDRDLGAAQLRLLDDAGLRALNEQGVEVGSHGMTHRPLPGVPAEDLDDELRGSAAALEALGLPRPRVLAYPHGEWTPEVAAAARSAGYAAAFTVESGIVGPGADRYALPRIEVLAGDTPRALRAKLASARRSPGPGARLLSRVGARR